MDQMKLYDISEPFMEIINPLEVDQVIKLGEVLGLSESDRIIDFGCGCAKFLAIWAVEHGISGTGIDIREYSVQRAKEILEREGVADRIEIVLADGKDQGVEDNSYDLAMCIGASFIWNGFRGTIQGMRDAIKPDGKLIIGEPYWRKVPVPEEYLKENPGFFTEIEILKAAREEGFDLEYMLRSSEQGWDNYEATNWLGLNHWLDINPDHPDRQQVTDWMRKNQEMYLEYGREYLGFAVYVFRPENE